MFPQRVALLVIRPNKAFYCKLHLTRFSCVYFSYFGFRYHIYSFRSLFAADTAKMTSSNGPGPLCGVFTNKRLSKQS